MMGDDNESEDNFTIRVYLKEMPGEPVEIEGVKCIDLKQVMASGLTNGSFVLKGRREDAWFDAKSVLFVTMERE